MNKPFLCRGMQKICRAHKKKGRSKAGEDVSQRMASHRCRVSFADGVIDCVRVDVY